MYCLPLFHFVLRLYINKCRIMKTLKLLTLLIATLLIVSCQSTEKLMDNGNYDQVIALAHKKLKGKKNKKEKYVRALERAFEKAVQRDMARIEILKNNGRADDWEKIIAMAESIELRQRRIQPFLPLMDREGYQAEFKFVKTGEILDYAENAILGELYQEGNAFLERGRNGDKINARKAYRAFDKIFDYSDLYFDTDDLRKEARALGINHVRIVQENAANDWMPGYLAGILTEDFPVSDGFWTQFTFDTNSSIQADLEARIIITGMDVGPELLRQETIERSKRIEDGWDYVYDERGNVAKDSLGNDIREKRFIRVRADVIRTHQEKGGFVSAQMRITDLKDGRILVSRPINSEARFYHMGQTFSGDRRALRSRDRRFIGLQPFPSDEELIIEAAQGLKPLFIKELKESA